ncbi:hypothetical protein ACJJIF_05380 [Microbulbifer sp. SSSA002]|uniref:hypothetical protein n=1 Tax=unclassified Microbulbifer TaxID=2619833 RepID=UPI00403A347C
MEIASLGQQLLPQEALERSARRAIWDTGAHAHSYPAPLGELALRNALSAHFFRYDFHFSANELVVTNGCGSHRTGGNDQASSD